MNSDTGGRSLTELGGDVEPILKAHGVGRASIVGSLARGDSGPDSHVVVLVVFKDGRSLLDLSARARSARGGPPCHGTGAVTACFPERPSRQEGTNTSPGQSATSRSVPISETNRASAEAIVSRDPNVHSGDSVFARTRVPVDTLVDYLKKGRSVEDFLDGVPSVERWQVEASLDRSPEAIEERGDRGRDRQRRLFETIFTTISSVSSRLVSVLRLAEWSAT